MPEQLLSAGLALGLLWESLAFISLFLGNKIMSHWAAWVGAIGSTLSGLGAMAAAFISYRSARKSEQASRDAEEASEKANNIARVMTYRNDLLDVKNSLVWLLSQFQRLSCDPQYQNFYLEVSQRELFESYTSQAMQHMSLLDAVVPGYKDISFDIARLWPKARVNLFRNPDAGDLISFPNDGPDRKKLIQEVSELIDRVEGMMSA